MTLLGLKSANDLGCSDTQQNVTNSTNATGISGLKSIPCMSSHVRLSSDMTLKSLLAIGLLKVQLHSARSNCEQIQS